MSDIEWGTLADWTVAGIALIALVQPYFLGGLKRLVYRPRLLIEETALIQLWTFDRGSLIGLRGAILSEHKDFFVRKISLNIVRKENKTEANFEWHATLRNEVRFDSVSGERKDEVIADLPYPFLVKQNQSAQYNLVFSQPGARERAQQAYDSVAGAWRNDFGKFLGANNTVKNDPATNLSMAKEFFRNTFSKSQILNDALRTLERDFFWLSGDYALKMFVHTSNGYEFSKSWSFSITNHQEREMRDSIKKTLRGACNLEPVVTAHVWTSYNLP